MSGTAPSEKTNLNELVYGCIQRGEYDEAVRVLEDKLNDFPRSRAALSLLGYSYYHMQDFARAAGYYERLVRVCPDVEEYRVYHAQSLAKAGSYHEASRAAAKVESKQLGQRVSMLQVGIKYEMNELDACKSILDGCLADDPETVTALAAVAFKEGKFEEAREKFSGAMDTLGYEPELAYNMALCHYKLKDYDAATELIDDIITRGANDHPELFDSGSKEEGLEARSVGNSTLLQKTQLVEAHNLRAAIEYDRNNIEEAKAALSDMPPRKEEELDPVTLHNQALIHMEDDPNAGFRKLKHLLSNPPFPPETLGNLLLLQCKHGYYDLAADILGENQHLAKQLLSPELDKYLDASILVNTDPEKAYQKYGELAKTNVDRLRKLSKSLSDAKVSRNSDMIKAATKRFEEEVERYIPVLMAEASLHWERGNYEEVEGLFRQSVEFCSDHEVWRLNLAHVFFMQQGEKFKDAIRYYEPFVKKASEKGVLKVPAIVLANLCVAYIMTDQKEKAEALIKEISTEEGHSSAAEPGKTLLHSCIVNLVIGTLYCQEDNFDFGIARICESLEPFDRKLGPETWFHAKRCILALAGKMSKHMVEIADETMHRILSFLDQADKHGKSLSAVIIQVQDPSQDADAKNMANTVSYEARQLKQLFMKLRE